MIAYAFISMAVRQLWTTEKYLTVIWQRISYLMIIPGMEAMTRNTDVIPVKKLEVQFSNGKCEPKTKWLKPTYPAWKAMIW